MDQSTNLENEPNCEELCLIFENPETHLKLMWNTFEDNIRNYRSIVEDAASGLRRKGFKNIYSGCVEFLSKNL